VKAVRLKTEYLFNPLGIDIVRPRLFWNCEGGAVQTAYRILAEDEAGNNRWDSGKVAGRRMAGIPWGGADLKSREHVAWKVKLWDEEENEGEWSEAAVFEAGLLRGGDWEAKWITGDYTPKRRRRYPVDCFSKVFNSGDIRKARLYITACGLYEARLNGKRAGGFVLAPGITDYRKRVQYQVYDVTSLINTGSNEITLELADGWYRGSVGAWGLTCAYGTRTKLLAQLELTDKKGGRTVIGSDASFAWSNDGPVRFADNKDGETVDANCNPTYNGFAKETSHEAALTSANNVPITEHEVFSPVLVTTPGGKTVLDFGQNIAGYVSFKITAKRGQLIRLRFGEMLDRDGEFTQKNIQCANKRKTTPLQQVSYTCRDGVNVYKTRFAIYGFRYVLVEGDMKTQPEDFQAIAVYSDMEETMRFDSSNELLNKFVKATTWSAKDNSADLPTDCPTRERHGWTGDAQIFFNTAGYLFDYAAFSRKFLRDMTDWQREDGCFPQIAPAGGVDFYMDSLNGSVGWADAGVLIPYRFWKLYGDEDILRDNYNAMRRYAIFMQKRCGKRALISKRLKLKGGAKKYAVNKGQAYGEWAEPADVHPLKLYEMIFPHPEEATAYTCHIMERMEEIALTLGKRDDAAEYRRYAEGTRNAYQALSELLEYTLDTDRQARLVRPLAFGLLNEKQTAFARKRLLQAIERYGWRLGTGFLSTPLILDVLAETDIELAYKLLENENMPGWLFMPKNGATTVWESWEGTMAQGGIASLNHYSKGACCEWLFRTMCGINVAGENRFTVAPRPGGRFAHAGCEYTSIYGKVGCKWEKTEKVIIYTITVPANTTAEIILPGGVKETIGAGIKRYEVTV
jgi:alpha-L-rhamnosidase